MTQVLDVAVVGGGLCGSRVLVELAARCAAGGPGSAGRTGHADGTRPGALEIALFDKIGAFGRGIPYGSRSERRGLLIENLAETRCPLFAEWLAENPAALEALEHAPHADDRAWFQRNRRAIAAREFNDLFIPRHVFGSFNAAKLAASSAAAEAAGHFNTARIEADIRGLERSSAGDYLLTSADGRCWRARHVVLAVGSIPRRDQFFPQPDDETAKHYLSDSQFCGSFALDASLDAYAAQHPVGRLRLAIIGAAASAIESLHGVLSHPAIASRIERVITLSPSGMLPGGVSDPAQLPGAVSSYARLRGSARDYLESARTALGAGLLGIVPARVLAVSRNAEGFTLRHVHPVSGVETEFSPHLVVNCSGAGSLTETTSELLRALAARLPVREDDRGFVMQADGTVHGWPGLYVIGPLLNEAHIDTHVESINAAFRAGSRVAGQLFGALQTARAECA